MFGREGDSCRGRANPVGFESKEPVSLVMSAEDAEVLSPGTTITFRLPGSRGSFDRRNGCCAGSGGRGIHPDFCSAGKSQDRVPPQSGRRLGRAESPPRLTENPAASGVSACARPVPARSLFPLSLHRSTSPEGGRAIPDRCRSNGLSRQTGLAKPVESVC